MLEYPIQVFSCEIDNVFKNIFFYRTPPVSAFMVLLKNNLIFSVLLITLGYNQNCHGILSLLSPSLYKNIHLLSKVRPSSPKLLLILPKKSTLHEPAKHLFLYNVDIFVGEWCIT